MLSTGQELAKLFFLRLHFNIIACPLDQPWHLSSPKIPLQIRPFEAADIQRIAGIDRPSEAKRCEERLAHGYYGLVGCCQDEIAGYAWAFTSIDPTFENVQLTLQPGDFVCDNAFTVPSFQGQGVQTALTLKRLEIFRNMGYRRAISYIEVHNHPSLAVWQRKFQGQTIGKIDFLRIGPWYRVRVTYNGKENPVTS